MREKGRQSVCHGGVDHDEECTFQLHTVQTLFKILSLNTVYESNVINFTLQKHGKR